MIKTKTRTIDRPKSVLVYVKPDDASLLPQVMMVYEFLVSRFEQICIYFEGWVI